MENSHTQLTDRQNTYEIGIRHITQTKVSKHKNLQETNRITENIHF